jgi:hypothetical protein
VRQNKLCHLNYFANCTIDAEVWKIFRRELLGEGFTSESIQRHRHQIKDHLRLLCENGLLDEEDLSCKGKKNTGRISSGRKQSVKPAVKAEHWISHTPLNIYHGSPRSVDTFLQGQDLVQVTAQNSGTLGALLDPMVPHVGSTAPRCLTFSQTGYPVRGELIPESRSYSNSISSLTRPYLEFPGTGEMGERCEMPRETNVRTCQDWSDIHLRRYPKSSSFSSQLVRHN